MNGCITNKLKFGTHVCVSKLRLCAKFQFYKLDYLLTKKLWEVYRVLKKNSCFFQFLLYFLPGSISKVSYELL